ncbi:MAG TPA: AbrB/MazE/SpoVT family DNA-binding domain-containing protein [Actinomycetota bacterium]|jgi:AbrB family looped-hinge helix DNA binding protein|nr:AbrB/MazE/SpoVT family DNA-binding domain-containing protein [Actinomycetota bacterium]
MKATIDNAGRLVIPKVLRERLGLAPGVVDVEVRGASLTITPIAEEALEAEDDLLIIPAGGIALTDEGVRTLRDVDRK